MQYNNQRGGENAENSIISEIKIIIFVIIMSDQKCQNSLITWYIFYIWFIFTLMQTVLHKHDRSITVLLLYIYYLFFFHF